MEHLWERWNIVYNSDVFKSTKLRDSRQPR